MISASTQERFNSALRLASEMYDMEGIPEDVRTKLNDLTLDINWLCDRLNSAWATVEAYQRELSNIYNNRGEEWPGGSGY